MKSSLLTKNYKKIGSLALATVLVAGFVAGNGGNLVAHAADNEPKTFQFWAGPKIEITQPNGCVISMAGPAGFEPANAGTKTQCLTTWRRPNIATSTKLF